MNTSSGGEDSGRPKATKPPKPHDLANESPEEAESRREAAEEEREVAEADRKDGEQSRYSGEIKRRGQEIYRKFNETARELEDGRRRKMYGDDSLDGGLSNETNYARVVADEALTVADTASQTAEKAVEMVNRIFATIDELRQSHRELAAKVAVLQDQNLR